MFLDPSMLLRVSVVCFFLLWSNICNCTNIECTIDLFIQFPVDGHLDCFQFGTTVKKTAMNIFIQVFLWTNVSFLLDKGVELLGHT